MRLFRHATIAAATLFCGALAVSLGAIVIDHNYPPDLSRLAVVGSEIVDREGRTVALRPAPGGVWRFRVAAEDVAPVLLATLVATEDRHFWSHPGVDPLSLLRAAAQDLRAGHIVSGGSTLTMQAARLLEPRPRNVRSKLIEIFRAFQLEARFSKRDILGIWLTLAPYGGNLEGVRAGALAWFGASPRHLEPAQAALLVAIPRRPEALRPDRHADLARVLRDRILGADGGDMPAGRLALPRHAPQQIASLPHSPRVETTLDLPLQTALERLAAERMQNLPERVSLAIVVADASSREIRAIVSGAAGAGGNIGEGRGGSLDLTQAVRSPGSALKPFIYAMAFQDGIAGPETLMDDTPHRFGSYAPEDFDRGFSGNVTAAEALRRSLNVPAVTLLDRVGPQRFAATLEAAGVRLRLRPGAVASLPLALGGAGITLRELTGLYAGLATGGDAASLRLVAGQAPAPVTFLQPRSANTVAETLVQPFPDGGPAGVAWKTGTSWGGRDSWALGFDAQHVVGIWIGRPDGTPIPGATGRGLALPVLSRVLALLPSAPRRAAIPSPAPRGTPARATDTLRLLFPPPGSILSGDGPITLRVMGGQRPLTFMIDGAPLAVDPARREASWTPAAPGFYRVTILDAAGASADARVRVKQEPGSPAPAAP